MHGDETPDAYLNRAQEYADALATISEPVKDKDLVMLVVSGLREEYNGFKTTITARQSPTAFSELHALLSDHDYMLEKTRTPIAPYGPQAFYGARPSNNNRSNNNNNRGNRNNSRGNNNRGRDNGRQFDWVSTQNTVHRYNEKKNESTGANSHVTPDLEAMDNSEAYYGDDALHVGNGKGLPILHIGSSKVYSPQKTFAAAGCSHKKPKKNTKANSHVTPNLEAMDNSEAYYGDDALHVGNGKGLPILHIGSFKEDYEKYESDRRGCDVFGGKTRRKIYSILNIGWKFVGLSQMAPQVLYVLCKIRPCGVLTSIKSLWPIWSSRGTTSHDLWYVPLKRHSTSIPHLGNTLFKTQLLRIEIHGDETPDAYLKSLLKEYANALAAIGEPVKDKDLVMLAISAFTTVDKTAHNSRKFAFTLSPTNYGYWKTMIEPFLITNNLMGYVDGSIPCPSKTLSVTDDATVPKENPNYPIWVSNDAHIRMLIISTISEASFRHVQGIIHRRSCPHTSEQNGFVERRNRHVVETGLTLLAQACVPQRFWHYAFDTAVYLINRMPSLTSTNKSPFEHIFKRSPDYSFLRVFGCLCFPHLRPYNHHKMDFRSTPYVFLGDNPSYHGYRCLDIARHVRFNEAQFPFDIPKTTSPPHSKTSPYYSSESPYVIPTTDHPSPSSPRSPISSPSSVSHLSPTSQTSPESSNGQPSPVSTTSIPTPPPPTPSPPPPPPPPPITRQRLSPEWRQAMKEEYDALIKNGTWSFVPRASTTNVVDGKWVYRLKRDKNGAIIRYKARFVAKGFRQQPDLGPLNYFLGVEIVPHVSDILLSQKKYILELLQSAGLSNCNPVSSPMVTSSSLSLDDSTAFINPVKYRQVVGSLQYVTLSRLDIAFAVNNVCQYMHAPTKNHWFAVKRILRYLHGTVEHGMLIRRSSGSTLQAFTDVLWKGNPDTSLEAFSDADWVRDSDDQWSTGGFAIYLGSNLISWTARKQRTALRSSTEAEYKALADTVAELTWLQSLLHELGIRSSSTPILWCDNLGATYLSTNPIFRARTKHVEIDCHFVREKVAQGDLRVQHISTHDQIAYIFTKSLPTPRFLFLRSKLQVVVRP
ncbi:retrovirus-related pol polyprotein from transposon TNT 1-94 [Tanacetum coccineum]